MRRTQFLLAAVLALIVAPSAWAFHHSPNLDAVNARLLGQVVDHTANHGADRRIWSPALCQQRDLYIYLPPGFDPHLQYPLMIWLHGLSGDERQFIDVAVEDVDRAIACGKLPPLIIAIPDGQSRGNPGIFSTHSGFINSNLGCYADYLECDVWNFVVGHYPVRPERGAHVIGGVSLGGGAAYHHAIKHRDRYASVLGIFPPVNLRWVDCHGRYFGNFDPNCWGWRTNVRWGSEALGRFYGVFKIPVRQIVYPLYGRGPDAVVRLSHDNPIEMLDFCHVLPGELAMWIAWGAKDEFNLDAQGESFVYRAHERGLEITALCDPNGRHNSATAHKFIPPAITWLAQQIAPYSPPLILECVK